MRRADLWLLLLSAPILAGCGERPTVLAEVGDRVITVEDFKDVLTGNESNYPVPPDSAKKLALRDMMRRELLVVEALKRGLDKDSAAVRYRRSVEDRVLVESYYQREAPAEIPVSEGEIAEFYAWRDSAAHAMLIYTGEREAADAAVRELRAGEPFADVANRYNLVGTMPPGGDIGFRLPGDLVEPLDDMLRTAAVGEILGPLQAPTEGWFLMQVVERRENPLPPLEQVSSQLEIMLRQRKQRALATRTYTGLRERYAVEAVPGGPQLIFQYYNRMLSGEARGLPPAEPDAAMLAEVVGRYKDAAGAPQVYTFGDALTDMRDARRNRPDVSLVPAIQRWIENQLVRRAAFLEAKRMHLEDEPEIARRIERETMTFLVEGLFTMEITNAVRVDEADLRQAYERRRDVLQKPFEALSPAELNAISTDAASFEAEMRFETFTDSLASAIQPFRMHEDRLARVPWPLSTGPAPQ
jgi:peptidyl-prolyl cis-trans isomerase C